MYKVYIDGGSGTTGLRIRERLAQRPDLRVEALPEELRKDPSARKDALNACDAAFLCLPDEAAIEAVEMLENDRTVLLDASTAHRTAPGWVYGFPELSDDAFQAVSGAKRIAVPGCHASGFVALVSPLVKAGILPETALLSCFSLTGYSGGGKKMIAQYEAEGADPLLGAPRQYALSQAHKHLPEMKTICGLREAPLFSPIVANFYSGMQVTVPLFQGQLAKGAGIGDIRAVYAQKYAGPVVSFEPGVPQDGFLSALSMSGSDKMRIRVAGNEDRILLVAEFDNLGKGASGAAIQCMNLALGIPQTEGLSL